MRIVHASEDIQIALVVRDLEFRLERRFRVDMRGELTKGGDLRCALPCRVVAAPVDDWSARRPHGDRRDRRGAWIRAAPGGEHGRGGCMLRRHREQQDAKREWREWHCGVQFREVGNWTLVPGAGLGRTV